MANIEHGARLSRKWWRLAVPLAALLLGVLMGLVIPHPFRWQWAASLKSPEPFVLSDWKYPQAQSLSWGESGSMEIKRFGVPVAESIGPDFYVYETPDALEKVWDHYGHLIGMKNAQFGGSGNDTSGSFNQGSGDYSYQRVLYESDPDRRAGTIVIQRPGYTAAVFISRGKGEVQTRISVLVQKRSFLPSF
jgi:hypothetical protein